MCVTENDFSYFSTKTYVLGAQKNRLIEHPKHNFRFLGKKIIAFLHSKSYLTGPMNIEVIITLLHELYMSFFRCFCFDLEL